MSEEREARYKIYLIDPDTVLAMLQWNTIQMIALPISKGLPDGAIVQAVNYDYNTGCFMAKVYHESFDIVKVGMVYPQANNLMEVEQRCVSINVYKKALAYDK